MSQNRPPSSRYPESSSSSRRERDYYDDRYYDDRPSRSGSSRGSSSSRSGSGSSRSSSSRSGSGGSSSRPPSSRSSGSRPRTSASGSSRNGSRPSSRPPGKRPPAKKRRRRSPLSYIILLALVLVLILVLRACVFSSPKEDGEYELAFETSATLVLGTSDTVSVSGLPEDFSGKIQWTSQDSSIVSISGGTGNTATITAVSEGNTIIAAIVNGKSASATVQVIKAVEGVASVTINHGSITILSGETRQLEARVLLETGQTYDSFIQWSSDDITVGRINNDGLITARDVGTANITATVGNQVAVCIVTVIENPDSLPAGSQEGQPEEDPEEPVDPPATPDPDPPAGNTNTDNTTDNNNATTPPATDNNNSNGSQPEGGGENPNGTVTFLALSQGYYYLAVGEDPLPLDVTVSPTGAKVTWSSSVSSVATVSDNGVVTPLGEGTTVITATAGGMQAYCTVQVTANPDTQGEPADDNEDDLSPETPISE